MAPSVSREEVGTAIGCVLFLKPTTSYAWPGEPLVLPRKRAGAAAAVHGVHHELELGVIIGQTAKGVTDEESAMACVAGFVLGDTLPVVRRLRRLDPISRRS